MPKNTQIRHSWSKIPKNGLFVPKFWHFCFLTKFYNYTNSKVLILNMTFSKILLQKYPDIFGLKFTHISFFVKFCNLTNSRMLISNMTIWFSNSSPKIAKSGIFCPNFRHFCFIAKFPVRQIWGCWFQIWQDCFQIQA